MAANSLPESSDGAGRRSTVLSESLFPVQEKNKIVIARAERNVFKEETNGCLKMHWLLKRSLIAIENNVTISRILSDSGRLEPTSGPLHTTLISSDENPSAPV
jgi:hypothetical protein